MINNQEKQFLLYTTKNTQTYLLPLDMIKMKGSQNNVRDSCSHSTKAHVYNYKTQPLPNGLIQTAVEIAEKTEQKKY